MSFFQSGVLVPTATESCTIGIQDWCLWEGVTSAGALAKLQLSGDSVQLGGEGGGISRNANLCRQSLGIRQVFRKGREGQQSGRSTSTTKGSANTGR